MNTAITNFKHRLIDIGNGIKLNTVTGGSGAPLFLLHGFPQTWQEWKPVMPELAKKFTVVAVDLKGSGQSDKPVSGYDKVTMPKPVFIGDTLWVETEVVDLRESKSRPNAGIVTFRHRTFNQKGEIVCEGLRTALINKGSA